MTRIHQLGLAGTVLAVYIFEENRDKQRDRTIDELDR